MSKRVALEASHAAAEAVKMAEGMLKRGEKPIKDLDKEELTAAIPKEIPEEETFTDKVKEKFGDFGSGYPSDRRTIDFLRIWIKEKKKSPPFARKSWATIRKIIAEDLHNKKITDFF